MRDIIIFSGSSNEALSHRICNNLSIAPGKVLLKKFANGETSVYLKSSVREKDVFILQSGAGNVNDNLIELLLMISACKMASAKRITVVTPLFFYSRQAESPSSKRGLPSLSDPISKPDPEATYKSWVAQSGMLIANLLTSAGANHILTMDLHDCQFQGFFDIPVDNLYSKPLVQHYIINYIPNYENSVIVSPDAGGAKRAAAVADFLKLPFALIHKERRAKLEEDNTPSSSSSFSVMASNNMLSHSNSFANVMTRNFNDSTSSLLTNVNNSSEKIVATTMLVGDVCDKTCVIVDDLADTATTLIRAAKLLKDQGAKDIYAIVTHGIFSGNAIEKIKNSNVFTKVITSNSVDQSKHLNDPKIDILDVSRIFSEAIRRINNGESVSLIYNQGW